MSEGWESKVLNDICFKITDGSHNPPKGIDSSEYVMLSSRNVFDDLITLDKPRYLKKDDFDSENKRTDVNEGDILLTIVGTVGRCAVVPKGFPKVTFQRSVAVFKPDSSVIESRFLMYSLRSILDVLLGSARGVAQKGVYLKSLRQLQLNIPSIEEQKRIVAILDEAFGGIDTAIANTEKNLANARELFESYLNLVFTKRGEGWCELTLKEVCKDYGRGKSKHRPRNAPELYGGDYPFIQTGEVRQSDHYITTYSKTYNEKGLSQSKLWPKGTICITIAANIAETGVLAFDACFPDSIIGLVVDQEKASNSYVEFLLQSLKSVLKAKGKGSAQDNINLGTFENLKFPFPSLNTQNEIVENVDELRMLIRRLETIYQQKLESLKELKQSLLQKAFSGELTTDNNKLMDEAVA